MMKYKFIANKKNEPQYSNNISEYEILDEFKNLKTLLVLTYCIYVNISNPKDIKSKKDQ